MRTTNAAEAFTDVLAEAGASRARDAVDERIVADVADGHRSGHRVAGRRGWLSEPAGRDPAERPSRASSIADGHMTAARDIRLQLYDSDGPA